MGHIQTNSFEIVDLPGMNTLAFLVEKEEALGNMGLSLQKLEHIDREEAGKIKKEFNVIPDNDDAQDIVLLTLTNNKAIVSTGELSSEGFVAREDSIRLSYGSIFHEEGVAYKEFAYTPNMKRRFTIVDTTTGDEVKPMLYRDTTTNEIKGKCKILPQRPYVVLEVKMED